MADRLLLESFTRPENLIEYQIEKIVKFEAEHRERLAAVEAAINPNVAPVTDSAADPIVLTCHPADRVDSDLLVNTSDIGFNKIMLVFGALCDESAFIKEKAHERFYAILSLFAHSKEDEGADYTEGVLEAMVGKCLPVFQDCANLCDRINALVLNLLQQVAALYGKGSEFAPAWTEVRLRPVFLALGDLLTVLITLDTIIRGNPMIAPAWEKYKRMADVMRAEPERFGGDKAAAAEFDRLLLQLDRGVMAGRLFRQCLDQPYDRLALLDPSLSCVELIRARSLETLEFVLGTVGSELETCEALQVVGQLGIYALYRALTSKHMPDPKVFERLWRVTEKLPLVPLYTKYVWTPDAFLVEYCAVRGAPLKLVPKDPHALREQVATELTVALPGIVNLQYTRVMAWLVKSSALLAPAPLAAAQSAPPAELLKARIVALTQALCLAHATQRHLSLFINYHLTLSRDVKKRSIEPLARSLEILKVLEAAVKAHAAAIAETLPHVQRDNAREVLEKVLPLRLKIATARGADTVPARCLAAAVELIETLAITTESWSLNRRIYWELAVSVVLQKAGVSKDVDVAQLVRALWKLGITSDYQTSMRAACDCSVLYWVRELLPPITACACTVAGSGPGDADSRQGGRLQYLFAAFSDAAAMLGRIEHLPAPPPPALRLAVAAGSEAIKPSSNPDSPFAGIQHISEAYEVLLHGILRHDVILPVARAVESDLRVHVHAVHLAHMEPPSLRTGKPPLVHLLSLPPVRILGALVDVKQEVTHYLERTFYELSTVALQDWKTYGEMASVAADKYGLTLTDNHLPMGSLETVTDVLQIMRNLPVFLRRFNYNLNQQFFIEKRSLKGGKHVDTVSLHSVSSSIRQHGAGMMNTTVNFAYQFLAKQFYVFSQFLFDEYIKSYLMKERRFFRRERKLLENRYPYSHAIELTRDIRKLGLAEDKLSYLDRFRQLISEIGNALGYVRMVRSAGMNAAAEAVKFVPDLTEVGCFEEAALKVRVKGSPAEGGVPAGAGAAGSPASAGADGGAGAAPAAPEEPTGPGLSPETLEAARELDAVLKNLTSNFSEGVDYFRLLVSVFQHVLLKSEKKGGASGAGDAGAAAPAPPPPTPSGPDGAPAAGAAGAGASAAAAPAKKEREDSHLRNFFLVIPALTLSFVDNLRNAKDRMEKSVKGTEAFFTDDGFALGIAYILAILKQDRAFESLHWWDSVSTHHASELTKYAAELATLGKSKADADKREELEFKRRRIATERREFEALYYAYRGARTFFREEAGEDDDDDAIALQV